MPKREYRKANSAQVIRSGKKRCFRHQGYFPKEAVWRDLDEFWSNAKQDTGLASNCKRCTKLYRYAKENDGILPTHQRNHIPADEREEIHTYIHQDTRKMLDHWRHKTRLPIGNIVDKALKSYLVQEMRKTHVNRDSS